MTYPILLLSTKDSSVTFRASRPCGGFGELHLQFDIRIYFNFPNRKASAVFCFPFRFWVENDGFTAEELDWLAAFLEEHYDSYYNKVLSFDRRPVPMYR